MKRGLEGAVEDDSRDKRAKIGDATFLDLLAKREAARALRNWAAAKKTVPDFFADIAPSSKLGVPKTTDRTAFWSGMSPADAGCENHSFRAKRRVWWGPLTQKCKKVGTHARAPGADLFEETSKT